MTRQSLIKLISSLKKGRLAGFFLLGLLLGCQPTALQEEQQLMQAAKTDAMAAKRLARQRLAANELPAALAWWRQAARLGAQDALEHAIRLQIRLEGKLATAHWVSQQPHLPTLNNSAILAELGLWSKNVPQTNVAAWQHTADCALTLQPVVSQAQGERTWQALLNAWQHDPQLAQLPVCFKPLLHLNSTELNCSEQLGQRIACNYTELAPMVAEGDFQQVLVIAGRGVASYNNGIVQLPEDASLALLRHEFMHIAGFLDEYALTPIIAKTLCQPGRIAPNLLVGNDSEVVARYVQRYGVPETSLKLTPVDTCNAVGIQAYRPIAVITPMRHLDAAIPALYQQLLLKALSTPQQLMPVQYYFAYLARQEQAWQNWQQFMQGAAAFGYPAAISALAVEVGE